MFHLWNIGKKNGWIIFMWKFKQWKISYLFFIDFWIVKCFIISNWVLMYILDHAVLKLLHSKKFS